MKIWEALDYARRGVPVRQIVWFDRWLEFDGALFWLRIIDFTGAEKEVKVVQTVYQSPSWYAAEWTTLKPEFIDDIPRVLAEVLKTPYTLGVRLHVDGSDYLRFDRQQLVVRHRKWLLPDSLFLKWSHQGDIWEQRTLTWTDNLSAPVDLGLDIGIFDQMSLEVIQARVAVEVVEPFANGVLELLFDDDIAGGDVDYEVAVTFSSSFFS